ncbi:hypothetical protein BZG36_00139 [Bifiguratus adelaidae]|uniref:Oxidized purine nucleoside triphosphate hydrolase n=1 Tax=Bifiguratus adelaidae TaxID=1938954 RepID=A0A261Y8I5_9FUNG|nr:hypothetical protein BZG36_00139 [Bifiguratus adelaidae]
MEKVHQPGLTRRRLLTLVLVHDKAQDRILLGMKKRGFGVGRYNGFGGKVEAGETIQEAASRELLEEACIVAKDLTPAGILLFSFDNDPLALEVHIFNVYTFEGTPTETEEMKPEWFKASAIPFHTMWADDEIWFPYMLAEKPFRGQIHFTSDTNTIKTLNVTECERIPSDHSKNNPYLSQNPRFGGPNATFQPFQGSASMMNPSTGSMPMLNNLGDFANIDNLAGLQVGLPQSQSMARWPPTSGAFSGAAIDPSLFAFNASIGMIPGQFLQSANMNMLQAQQSNPLQLSGFNQPPEVFAGQKRTLPLDMSDTPPHRQNYHQQAMQFKRPMQQTPPTFHNNMSTPFPSSNFFNVQQQMGNQPLSNGQMVRPIYSATNFSNLNAAQLAAAALQRQTNMARNNANQYTRSSTSSPFLTTNQSTTKQPSPLPEQRTPTPIDMNLLQTVQPGSMNIPARPNPLTQHSLMNRLSNGQHATAQLNMPRTSINWVTAQGEQIRSQIATPKVAASASNAATSPVLHRNMPTLSTSPLAQLQQLPQTTPPSGANAQQHNVLSLNMSLSPEISPGIPKSQSDFAIPPEQPQSSPTRPVQAQLPEQLHQTGNLTKAKIDGGAPRSQCYVPKTRHVDTFGGVNLQYFKDFQIRPMFPTINELGAIDIHALTMSLKSGLNAEITNALNTLTFLTANRNNYLQIAYCQDLLDVLTNYLMVSKEPLPHQLSDSDRRRTKRLNYSTMIEQSLDEMKSLDEYDAPASVKRCLCVANMLRNLSFHSGNVEFMARNGRFRTALVDAIDKAYCGDMSLTPEWSTFLILELQKHLLVLVVNLGPAAPLTTASDAQRYLNLIYHFMVSPGEHSYYRHLAIEVWVKLTILEENRALFWDVISKEAARKDSDGGVFLWSELATSLSINSFDASAGKVLSTIHADQLALIQLILMGLHNLAILSPSLSWRRKLIDSEKCLPPMLVKLSVTLAQTGNFEAFFIACKRSLELVKFLITGVIPSTGNTKPPAASERYLLYALDPRQLQDTLTILLAQNFIHPDFIRDFDELTLLYDIVE